MNLLELSISSWGDLCEAFITNFKGTYDRLLTINDMRAFRPGLEEPLRKFIQRFSQVRNQVP